MDDQIALLRHKLYLIQQGMAFNGKRTKTARSQGKKFQVSVEQEATRLLVKISRQTKTKSLLFHFKFSDNRETNSVFVFSGELGVGFNAAEQLH